MSENKGNPYGQMIDTAVAMSDMADMIKTRLEGRGWHGEVAQQVAANTLIEILRSGTANALHRNHGCTCDE